MKDGRGQGKAYIALEHCLVPGGGVCEVVVDTVVSRMKDEVFSANNSDG